MCFEAPGWTILSRAMGPAVPIPVPAELFGSSAQNISQSLSHLFTSFALAYHRWLQEKRPEVKLCLAEPADAPLIASGHKMERAFILLCSSGLSRSICWILVLVIETSLFSAPFLKCFIQDSTRANLASASNKSKLSTTHATS